MTFLKLELVTKSITDWLNTFINEICVFFILFLLKKHIHPDFF